MNLPTYRVTTQRTVLLAFISTLICVVGATQVIAKPQPHKSGTWWGASEPLLRSDNTQVPGGCPVESPGGKFLFTARNPGTGLDIYVNERPGLTSPFDPGLPLPAPVNDAALANDFCPTPLTDGQLYFVSTRDGGCGSADIHVTVNNPAAGYAVPTGLACAPEGPNTPGLELSPSVITTLGGTYLYFSTDYYTGNQDIYVSRMRADGTFGPGKRLPAPVNTDYDDRQPNVSRHGRELVFASNRPSYAGDDSGFDIFSVRRPAATNKVTSPKWRHLVNLSERVPFPTLGESETRPTLSWDGKRLVYGSGGVWLSTHKWKK